MFARIITPANTNAAPPTTATIISKWRRSSASAARRSHAPPQLVIPLKSESMLIPANSSSSAPPTRPVQIASLPIKRHLRARSGDSSVIVLGAEVRDQLVALGVAQRVLQLHELDEQVVLGI